MSSPRQRIADLRSKRDRLILERSAVADKFQDSLTGSHAGLGAAEGLDKRIERLDTGIGKLDTEIDELVAVERQALLDGVTGRGDGFLIERGSDGNYDDDAGFNFNRSRDPWIGERDESAAEVRTRATSEINAAGEALVPNDVYGLLQALPARWRPNATWQIEMSTRNFIHRLFNPTGTEPPLVDGNNLIGVPYVLNSSVDPYSAVNAAATASNMVAIVGDWNQYVILDRAGLSVHFVPPGHLLNTANNLPDGRVGWYAYWRTGANVLTINAFRMLDVATAA